MILKQAPLPEDILTLGVDGINKIWRGAKVREVEIKRAKPLTEAAEHSVGSKEDATSVEIIPLDNDLIKEQS